MNIKTKNSIAIGVFFIAVFVCYTLALSKTIAYKKQYHQLQKEAVLFKNIPQQLRVLVQKERYYDSLQQAFQITETSIQNNLLRTINDAAVSYDFKLIDFNQPHVFEENNLREKSYRFTIEGPFMSMLKLIHHLEQKTKYGEIIHWTIEKKKDHKTRQQYLQAQIIVQHVG